MRSPSPKSFPSPLARYPDYRHRLPAPWRGREEAAVAAGRWGCFRRLKHRHSGTPRQGRYSPDTDPPVPGENPPSSPVHPRRATSQPSGPQSSLTLKPVFPIPLSSAGRSCPPVYPRIFALPCRRHSPPAPPPPGRDFFPAPGQTVGEILSPEKTAHAALQPQPLAHRPVLLPRL